MEKRVEERERVEKAALFYGERVLGVWKRGVERRRERKRQMRAAEENNER